MKKYSSENILKQYLYRKQTSGYQWGEGREEGQYKGEGLTYTHYYI